ncbi:Ligand-Gated ion Channel [Caenorhabditis elegans]|uniref:Ligand-Gated ion Channel n=1 Tax=Caenorhabditis elegans TaxID=6239 RepID=A0A8S4QD70_CAEEL|nr:Ligand-Gated ion Channel [Caenorhabditis elegans]CAH2176079.1 Ligand-Gated ion Channel [Caenorhabditis elegans]
MTSNRWLLFFLLLRITLANRDVFRLLQDKPMPRNGNPKAPLQVHFGFYVESLGNFRATEMTYDMDMYLYMSWQDDSMRHNETEHVLVNDKDILDKIWLPDLYFANARTAYFHKVTVHNFNMFISPQGTISYGTRVTLNLACNLDLKDYPLDYQTCYIKVISYAHVKNEMNVSWFPNDPIRFNPEIDLPEFHIRALDKDYCNGVFLYTLTHNSSRVGEFSCLLGMLKLKRAIGFHLVQSYIPTGLIVAISWVSFWIDRRAVPARVSLSFTTLLTLSTQGNGIRYALPAVSYAKAIDYFYGVCMLFIFGVLLEFAAVNSYMRRANKYNHMAEKIQSAYGGKPIIAADYDSDYEEGPTKYYGNLNKNSAHLMYKALKFSRKALSIDKAARFAFPCVFAIFNVFYWLYYLREPPLMD